MMGQTVLHYRILEELGRGGMGVVYKAQDTRLDRPVALKFLPPQLSASEEDKARFIQEAKAASAMNHPNVCTVYSIDEYEGQLFIAMEYVEGQTLRELIGSLHDAGMPVKRAVEISIQIAEGLAAAHEKGIVHRDVKSENIMVTGDRRIKIMDFGLAKLRGVSKLTKTGSTVGTAAYMSPEQIEGIETDHRTDIFSFGVVLYELLAGQLPFRAGHETAMIYEIINVDPPPVSTIRSGVDEELNRVVVKCLEKDRDVRYQSMREVVVDLKRFLRASEGKRIERSSSRIMPPPVADTAMVPRVKKSISPIVISVSIALIAAAIALFLFLRRELNQESTAFQQASIKRLTSLPGLEDEPTWSPDGKFLAYTADDRGNFDILVQPVEGGQIIRIVDSDADDAQPAWSPDGSRIAFVSARDRGGRFSMLFGQGLLESYLKGKGGDIFLVPAFGGKPVKLVSNGFDPGWSPDSKTIVYRSIQGSLWELRTVPAEGGIPQKLTNDSAMDYQPCWSPDGEWILYGSAAGASGAYSGRRGSRKACEVRVIPSSGGAPKNLTTDSALVLRPTWSSDGKYIFFSSDRKGSMNIWRIPFKPEATEFVPPIRVTVGEGDDVNISMTPAGNRLAFSTLKTLPDIWELTIRTGKLRQVSFETGLEDHPVLSPDGKTLLVQSDRGGSIELWTMDLQGGFLSQLTTDAGGEEEGYWSPDGKAIAYARIGHGVRQAVIRSLGEVSPRSVIDNATSPFWSPDGTRLVFLRFNTAGTRRDVWIHALDTGEEKQLTSLDWSSAFPSWSPDGRWIAFNVEKENTREIWLVPSSGGSPRLVLSGEAEFSHPMWSPRDKDVILCLRDHKDIVQVSVSTGRVKELHRFTESAVNLIDYPSWSPDGQKIYFSIFRKTGDIYTLENF